MNREAGDISLKEYLLWRGEFFDCCGFAAVIFLSPRISLADIGMSLRNLAARSMIADSTEEQWSIDSNGVVPVSVSIRMSLRQAAETMDYEEDRNNANIEPCEACTIQYLYTKCSFIQVRTRKLRSYVSWKGHTGRKQHRVSRHFADVGRISTDKYRYGSIGSIYGKNRLCVTILSRKARAHIAVQA